MVYYHSHLIMFTELGSNHEYNTRHKTNFRHVMHKMKTFLPQGQKYGTNFPSYIFVPKNRMIQFCFGF